MTLREKAQLAEKAARASGEMLLSHPHTPAKSKGFNDFVTEMDVASEKLIRSILLGECPEDGFYGEESGESGSTDGRWIVDPIDGTSNFFKGYPLYTVSIAYELKGELVVGCVYCPATNEMFIGIKGEGAYLNGEPIHVSDVSVDKESFLHISFNHRHPWANDYIMERMPAISKAVSDMRRSASAAYDLCCIASGRAEAFFENRLYIYDVAAGIVILEEAGGRVTSWREGETFDMHGNIIASNGILHEFVRGLLLSGDTSALDKENPI